MELKLLNQATSALTKSVSCLRTKDSFHQNAANLLARNLFWWKELVDLHALHFGKLWAGQGEVTVGLCELLAEDVDAPFVRDALFDTKAVGGKIVEPQVEPLHVSPVAQRKEKPKCPEKHKHHSGTIPTCPRS